MNWKGMFNGCHSLISIDLEDGGALFYENEKRYRFTTREINLYKAKYPDFTFEDKNIPELRIIFDVFLSHNYPEELL